MIQEDGFKSMSSQELRRYRDEHKEGDYTLVDVRQPAEYHEGHIPGAVHISLGELEERFGELAPGKEHIFYCRSGMRSRMGVRLALDSGHFTAPLLNLDGGIMGYDGVSVPDTPRIQVFAGADSLKDALLTAMNLEKGAERVYAAVRESSTQPAVCELMETLLPMERVHAQSVYSHLQAVWPEAPPFDELYAELPGDIAEGGMPMDELAPWIRDAARGACMELAELSMELEMNAFDLYVSVANSLDDPAGKEAFLNLAEQEKAHARLIMKKLDAFLE